MLRIFALGAATLALATSALAADLPSRKAPPPAAPLAYAPLFTWTGGYVGVNAGYAWGKVTKSGSYFDDPSGFAGGAQVGANYQLPNGIVLGAEADIQYSGLEGKANSTGVAAFGEGKHRVEWFGTVRPRVGYAFDRTLLYVTGGLAYGEQKVTAADFGSASSTNIGWTAGAGAEYAFTNNWTAKVEGLYVNLGEHNNFPSATPTLKSGTEFGVMRAGLNYKF